MNLGVTTTVSALMSSVLTIFIRFISRLTAFIEIKLLEKDPQKRLGTPGCSAGDIIDQPFFKSINWDRLDRKEIEPPFKPKVVRLL